MYNSIASKSYKLECYNLKMVHVKRSRQISPIMQIVIAFGSGLAAFLLLFMVLNIGISLFYVGRIMPGVTMNGIPLSGMTVEEAATAITASYRFPETGNILLVDGQNSWPVKPVQLGFYLDPLASANSAYNAGRRGRLMQVLMQRVAVFKQDVQVQPSFIFDQKTAVNALNALAVQINQPVREASISIEGTQVLVQNGQSGRVLDVQATLDAITQQIQTMQDGVVSLMVRQSAPVIISAEAQGELARTVLSEPLTLTLPADASGQVASFQIQPADLAPLLTFAKVENGSESQYTGETQVDGVVLDGDEVGSATVAGDARVDLVLQHLEDALGHVPCEVAGRGGVGGAHSRALRRRTWGAVRVRDGQPWVEQVS